MSELLTHDLEIVDVDTLTLHPDNPRSGTVDAIADSIDANGFYGALVAQRSTRRILVGNHRYQAAIKQGLTQLPVIFLDVDDDRARRIMIADNRLAELAQWDDDTLAALLTELSDTDAALTGTGFTDSELAALVGADQFDPTDTTNRVDASGEHECPSCGYTWRIGPNGTIITSDAH